MRIINNTIYDTKAIRTLVVRAHNLISRTEGRLPSWYGLVVKIDYGNSGLRMWHGKDHTTGHASYSGYHMHLFMPKSMSQVVKDAQGNYLEHPDAHERRSHGRSGFVKERLPVNVETRECAWTIYHELWHNYGYRHGHFHDATKEDVDRMVVGLPERMAWRIREKKQVDHVALREAKARKMLTVWERREQTAKRKVKEYRKKVRYYDQQTEGKLAAESPSEGGANT